ncbi:unnamed protein product [Macrosiphum euphorbiae]|uniref:Uncharacterized protein n=1 Tax=Macrosiphum euphorbiae TaxID=13131 RepID=A0AAV0W199_9HEMI|nr:unnamed protein product [Macrosiphum euphorbiae]
MFARSFKFCLHLHEKLKDKFVTGLGKVSVIDRLCELEPDKLFIDLVYVALKCEASNKECPFHSMSSVTPRGNKRITLSSTESS